MSDQPAGERPQSTGPAAKLCCKNVWKIFGDDVPSLIGADGSVDEASFGRNARTAELARRGLIDLPRVRPGDIVDLEYRHDDLVQTKHGKAYLIG